MALFKKTKWRIDSPQFLQPILLIVERRGITELAARRALSLARRARLRRAAAEVVQLQLQRLRAPASGDEIRVSRAR